MSTHQTIAANPVLDPATPLESKWVPTFHLDSVDALRGLAAMLIVVYHFFAVVGSPEIRIAGINLMRPLNDGWCAVNLFLVLSGFCLYWPYARDPGRPLQYVPFMRRRCLRILPAYYAALLFVPFLYVGVARLNLCTPHAGVPKNAADILVHLAMLHSFTPRYFDSWNGVSWSLGLEWIWYLAFPLVVWMFRRFGPLPALLALVLCELTYRIGLYVVLGPASRFPADQLDVTFTLRTFLFGRLVEFGLGMSVAAWLVRGPVPRRVVHVCLVMLLPMFGLAHWAERFDVFLPVRDILYGITFSMLLVIMATRAEIAESWNIGKVLRSIGIYSYSLYLFHMPFVHFALGVTTRWFGLKPVPAFLLALLFIPVILLACRGAYQMFERPFLILRGPPPQSSAAAPVITATASNPAS